MPTHIPYTYPDAELMMSHQTKAINIHPISARQPANRNVMRYCADGANAGDDDAEGGGGK